MKDLRAHEWWILQPGREWMIDECKRCGLIRYGWMVRELGSFKYEWYFNPTPPGSFFGPHHSPGCK